MAGVSLIYELEINVSIQIVHLNIWTTIDPYNSYVNQASAMLTELRTYWTANNGFIARDLVHMMTKRSNTGTGGIAYRDVLCNHNWGYGFSSDLNNDTTYNFPNPSYTWNLTLSHYLIDLQLVPLIPQDIILLLFHVLQFLTSLDLFHTIYHQEMQSLLHVLSNFLLSLS